MMEIDDNHRKMAYQFDKVCPTSQRRTEISSKMHKKSHQGVYNLSLEIWHFWPGILKDCKRCVMNVNSV